MKVTEGDAFFATLENALLLARRLSMPLSVAAVAAGKDKAKDRAKDNARYNDKKGVREVNGMFISPMESSQQGL
jgi:hypothetical protein